MTRILIAPNSFKECADSVEIGSLLEFELRKLSGGLDITTLPLSDGGDGFLRVCARQFQLKILHADIPACYGEEHISVPFGYSSTLKTMYIESAIVVGLAIVPSSHRKPLQLTSAGLGMLLQKIEEMQLAGKLDIQKIVVGLGGTAINDLGLGLAAVFGIQLLDEKNNKLTPLPVNFTLAKNIILPSRRLKIPLELIVDVEADLVGEKGTSRVFGPQKGASAEDVAKLDAGFQNILEILEKDGKFNFSDRKIGAAGGIGVGLSLIGGTNFVSAESFLRENLRLREHIKNADIIITGEGHYDEQSRMKKAPDVVISESNKLGKKVIFIAGDASRIPGTSHYHLFTLRKYFRDTEDSIKNFKLGIEFVSHDVLKWISKSF